MTRPVLLVLAACLLATACGEQPDVSSTGSSAAPAASAATSAPAGSPAASPTPAGFDGDTARDEQEATGGPLSVTAVRAARHDGFDRVVFELDGRQAGEPGWTVEYVDDPRRDGSGDPVEVEGEATLVVLISGTGYPFDTGAEEAQRADVSGTTVVEEVALGSVFEGVYEAFIGVSREAPFRVFRLADPARVVVDISHG